MKKISPYLGLYRAMFIVTILIALAYATFNFFQYQNSMRELTINNKPSVQIERNYTERLQMYEAYQLEKEKNPELYPDKTATFDVLPTRENTASELFGDPLSAPISELDVLWLNGLYAALVGSTLTFLFALATIVSALFALNTKRIAAFLAPLFIFFVFISNQVTLFFVNDLFRFNQYNQYFFNFLELIFILALLGLTIFTIFHHPSFHHDKK